ncbi:MAG: hypothetical protein FJ285_07135 [Planctomycetes bacterium]|nr:hypothetical protein [Planctomycetota bacterium]
MSDVLTAGTAVRELAAVIDEDETILLVVRPAPWFIVATSARALPAAAAAGAVLALVSIDPSIPWDLNGSLLAFAAIMVARAVWQSADWLWRVYVLTDRRVVVRRGVLPEVSECPLTEVAGIGQPQRWVERFGKTGSLAVLCGPSRRTRRAWRLRQAKSVESVLPVRSGQMAPSSANRKSASQHRVRVATELEWSVIRTPETVRQKILHAVTRYR